MITARFVGNPVCSGSTQEWPKSILLNTHSDLVPPGVFSDSSVLLSSQVMPMLLSVNRIRVMEAVLETATLLMRFEKLK